MIFLLEDAAAAVDPAYNSGQLWVTIGTFAIVIAFLYFGMIRPQKKQEKQVTEMRNNLHVGDEVSTNGGLIGRIVKIKDDIITLETGTDKTKLKFFKWAIRSVEIPIDAPAEEAPKK
ncbi:hypothetical protein SDC9_140136 [bioreactor metagenome]|uniref:Sec translocon accessory complex subunit YajC n=1 Tax=bioreactor metagenome TaxID=1076179 RepID=A0A645DU33_9ZZZZ|nr:preprotein translocase subunit YajC [Oscillospiraceae bacterium]